MKWLKTIPVERLHAVLDKDCALVFQHCGLDVLQKLWQHLPGMSLYVSEKPLFELKRQYIRQHFDPKSKEASAKALAAELGVSEKFVYNAIATTDEKDVRQEKLL